MNRLLLFGIMTIASAALVTGCGATWSYANRLAANARINSVHEALPNPSTSVLITQQTDAIPHGNGDVCSGSDIAYVIGTHESHADIFDYYHRHFGANWKPHAKSNFYSWMREEDQFTDIVVLAFDTSELIITPAMRDEFKKTSALYSSVYILMISSGKCR